MKTLKQLINQWRNKAQQPITPRISYEQRKDNLLSMLNVYRQWEYRLGANHISQEMRDDMQKSYNKQVDAIKVELALLEMLHELDINQ
jgi:hypothetical protein